MPGPLGLRCDANGPAIYIYIQYTDTVFASLPASFSFSPSDGPFEDLTTDNLHRARGIRFPHWSWAKRDDLGPFSAWLDTQDRTTEKSPPRRRSQDTGVRWKSHPYKGTNLQNAVTL